MSNIINSHQQYLDTRKERKIQLTLVKLTNNGFEKQKIERFTYSHTNLLDFLRDQLNLTGAKESCGVGECGACTVILNGQAVRACLILAFEADGAEVLTIEGLASGKELHPLQKSFIKHDAAQCGYCTPGFLLAAYNLYQTHPEPTKEQIWEAMGGHLCRCTGYQSIYRAIADPQNKTSHE